MNIALRRRQGQTSSATYGRHNVYAENHHDIQSELARVHNLVTMSGPVWNAGTEIYLGLLGCPVTFYLTAPELRSLF